MSNPIGRRACLAGLAATAALAAGAAKAAPLERPRAVLQKYFRLINQRRFYAAFHVWELETDGRNSAGQTLKQFAAGFAKTQAVIAEVGDEIEGNSGAGSEYMDIPVSLDAILKSGKRQQFLGDYTMRRSLNPDGHQDWLIYTATMSNLDDKI